MSTTSTPARGNGLNCWRRCPGEIVAVPSSDGARYECRECGQALGTKADLEELAAGSGAVASLAEAVLEQTGEPHAP